MEHIVKKLSNVWMDKFLMVKVVVYVLNQLIGIKYGVNMMDVLEDKSIIKSQNDANVKLLIISMVPSVYSA